MKPSGKILKKSKEEDDEEEKEEEEKKEVEEEGEEGEKEKKGETKIFAELRETVCMTFCGKFWSDTYICYNMSRRRSKI